MEYIRLVINNVNRDLNVNHDLTNSLQYTVIKGDIVYIKYNKFIITIKILKNYDDDDFNYDDFINKRYNIKYSFIVLIIENIVTREHVRMKGRYIIGKKYNRREYIFRNYKHAYFHNFIEKEQWKLFPNGFTGECKILNIDSDMLCLGHEEIFYMINGIKEGQYQKYQIFKKERKLIQEGNFVNGKEHGIFKKRKLFISEDYDTIIYDSGCEVYKNGCAVYKNSCAVYKEKCEEMSKYNLIRTRINYPIYISRRR
jgi:hypothetical protein